MEIQEMELDKIVIHQLEHIKAAHQLEGSNYFTMDMDTTLTIKKIDGQNFIKIILPEQVADIEESLQNAFCTYLNDLNKVILIECTA